MIRKVIKTSRPGLVFLFYYCFQSVLNPGNKICQITQLALSCNSVRKADTVDCTRPTRPVKGLFFIKMNPNTWPKKITRPRPVLLSICTRVVSNAAVAEWFQSLRLRKICRSCGSALTYNDRSRKTCFRTCNWPIWGTPVTSWLKN